MKYSVALLILLLPLFSRAQTGKVRSDTVVMNELIDSWTVGLSEEGNEPANIRVFNKFKSLFMPEATLDDEINAVYNPSSINDPHPYKTETKTVEFYAHDLALEFMNLKLDSVSDVTYTSGINDSIITATFTAKVSGEKNRQYVFENIPTLADNIIKQKSAQHKIEGVNKDSVENAIIRRVNDAGNKPYKFQSTATFIVSIARINDTLRLISSIRSDRQNEIVHCLSDSDLDGVIYEEDSCPKTRGDLTAMGCIDSDLDGIADSDDACVYIFGNRGNGGCPPDYFTSRFELAGFVGVQLNSVNARMPELDKLGYNSLDFNESQEGSMNDPGLIVSPSIGIDFTYFLGNRKKDFGVSLGATFTRFSALYEISSPPVYTFKSNDGADDYRRRITLREGSTEEEQYNVLNFPLLFHYRHMIGQAKNSNEPYKWTINLSAGPSLLLFNSSMKYNSNIDFEGLYQVDTVLKDAFTYYDYFDNSSTWNMLLTADDINQQSSFPGADSLFNLLNQNGYDFASNKNYSGEVKNTMRTSIALNARVNLGYRLDENVDAIAGISFLFAPLPDNSDGYELIDKTTDPYNPIINSDAAWTYFSLGINVGLVLHW